LKKEKYKMKKLMYIILAGLLLVAISYVNLNAKNLDLLLYTKPILEETTDA
tara:strand:- start:115 stop:267 length:153 start_codon:yes stop_codon:yes gene_type:complete